MRRDLPFEPTHQDFELPETTAAIRALSDASVGNTLAISLANGRVGEFRIKKINWFYYSEEPWSP
jgi:hypothetical protein